MIADFWTQVTEVWQSSPDFWAQTGVFLSLVLRSLGLALLIGLPVGMALTAAPRLAAVVIAVLGLLQTVPSLALLGLLIVPLGIGQALAVVTAVLYSLFPIVLNTYVGITQVPPAIRDAARGMGMTAMQTLWTVELPLAFPVVLAGIRTGAIYAIGIITVCALAGAGGLGDYIVSGMTQGNNHLVLLGAVPILVLTLALFCGLGGIAWLARKNNRLGLAVGGALIVLLSAASVAEPLLRPRRADVVVGAKNFTEGQILAEIVRQMLEAHTDLTVGVVPNLGPDLAYKALQTGQIDVYPEYTGVLLTNKDALNLPVPEDKGTITDLVRTEMLRRHHLVLLDTFGLNNTYALCVRREVADRFGLQTIRDLAKVPEMEAVVDLSFLRRPDGWQGLVAAYDLHFRNPPRQVSPDLLYKALDAPEPTLVVGFATDWQISAYHLVVLEDNKHYFPSYHGAPLVREAALKRHPEIAAVLNRLKGQINDEAMRRMNAAVALKKRPVAEVAEEFLRGRGLLDR